MYDGALKVTGTHQPVLDNKYLPYIESWSRFEYVGQVTQSVLEEFYQDLIKRWPHLEDFTAHMSPATLKEYSNCLYPRERILLTER